MCVSQIHCKKEHATVWMGQTRAMGDVTAYNHSVWGLSFALDLFGREHEEVKTTFRSQFSPSTRQFPTVRLGSSASAFMHWAILPAQHSFKLRDISKISIYTFTHG